MPRTSIAESSSFDESFIISLVIRKAIGNAMEINIRKEKKMIHWGSSKTSKYTQASGLLFSGVVRIPDNSFKTF